MQVKGSIALVTGANRGVGRATIKVLMEQGASKVYATARDASKIADLAAAYPGKVEAHALDITKPEQVSAAAARAKDVNLLINNATSQYGCGSPVTLSGEPHPYWLVAI